MSERHKTHNGRDRDGNFRVKQEDVEDLLENPAGAEYLEDDVRLGGAVADTGAQAGQHAHEIGRMIDENRLEVERLVHPPRENGIEKRPARRHRGNH
jgi:hypothetical protein